MANFSLEEVEDSHAIEFVSLVNDFVANDKAMAGQLFSPLKPWQAPEFQSFVKECEHSRKDWRPKAKEVSVTHYVLLDQARKACGYGLLQFPLTPETEQVGGNLRFYVPPAKRGQDYEVYVLNSLLFEAVRAGLARALVTCGSQDLVSIRAIEMNRGQLENKISLSGQVINRYWITFR